MLSQKSSEHLFAFIRMERHHRKKVKPQSSKKAIEAEQATVNSLSKKKATVNRVNMQDTTAQSQEVRGRASR